MDEQIQKGLRYLAKANLSTGDLLRRLNISKIYLLQGVIEGVFFSLPELLEEVIHHSQQGYLAPQEAELEKLKIWVSGDQSSELTLACSEAVHWFTPKAEYQSELHIKVLLVNSGPSCCNSPNSVSRLNQAFIASCENENCEEDVDPCIQHLLACHNCGKAVCFGCATAWLETETGNIVLSDEISGRANPLCVNCEALLRKKNEPDSN